jgi:hypothetical protein
MTIPALILVAVAGVLSSHASPRDGVNPPTKEDSGASAQKIRELQKERLATRKELVDTLTILVRAKLNYYEEALEARLLLLQAEQETAEKQADRILLYEKAIESLKQYEEWAKGQVQAGKRTEATVRKTKAVRLKVEIQLEQAKRKEVQKAPVESRPPLTPEGPKGGAKPAAQEQIGASAQKIKELQKERIAILKEVVDEAVRNYQKARGSYEEVLKAQMLFLQAELDAAEKESERVTLFKRAVETLSQYEKSAQRDFQGGRATNAPILRIKARRLEVEIQLEQAKIKEAKEGK